MRRVLAFLVIFTIAISSASLSAAERRTRGDSFSRPQVGFWFGPVTPVYETWDDVNSTLGGGGFFRLNLPYRPLKVGIDASYEKHKSEKMNQLVLAPIYGNLLYRLPINLPINFQLKAGAGGCYVRTRPDNLSQYDPLLMTGVEMSFPAGKIVNIGLRIDYIFIYEKHIAGAKKNGHIINSGITLYFNIPGM